jgi:peptide/nickel transport system substrate-binding protein
MKRRLLGIVITASMFAAGYAFWRSPGAPGSRVSNAETQSHGGQLVASIRAVPRSFNRLIAREQTAELLSLLTQGRLVRINRSTFELEPWLAEQWDTAADGRTFTLHLRPGVTWSDGAPFTAADVLFTLQAVFDPKVESVVTEQLTVGGKPIAAAAPDDHTIVLTYPTASGPGLRLFDALVILPKHKLEGALRDGTFANAWNSATPPAEIVGTGPFTLREYAPGQRLVLDRNPRYWRKAADGTQLPYLDRIVLQVVPDQDAELVRLQGGDLDMTQSELRPDDYVVAKRAETQGKLKLVELGVGPDADAFWFDLKPEAWKNDPRFAFVSKREFRQAISHAVDREAFAEHVFLGAAVPIWGPVTPGNKIWFSPNVLRYPHDVNKAKEMLKGIGLEDRNGNGIVEDAQGHEARFTVITQRGVGWFERGTNELRTQLARVGIALEVAAIDNGALIKRMLSSDYEAIYYRPLATDLDPAVNMDFWLSSGSAHFWNLPDQTSSDRKGPPPQEEGPAAQEWETRIDMLMAEQASTTDLEMRKRIFNEVQKTFAENLPVLYFVAPRLYYAHNARVLGVVPSVQRPPALWNADMLSVRGGP